MAQDGDDNDHGESFHRENASRRKGRPSKRRSADLTGVIVEVATRLFLDEGFQTTSMDAIAAEAGSSKRTLYARFPSKVHLFEEVVRQHVLSGIAPFATNENREEPLDVLLPELGIRLYDGALHPRNIALFRLMAAETFRHKGTALVDQNVILNPLLGSLSRIFEKRIAKGEIIDRPPFFLAEQFLESVCASDIRRAIYGRPQLSSLAERHSRVSMAIDLFLRAVRRSVPQPPPLVSGPGDASAGARPARSGS